MGNRHPRIYDYASRRSDLNEAVRYGAETFHALAKILKEEGYPTTVGDEGGYAPRVQHGNEEPLKLISRAVEAAGYRLGEDIAFASSQQRVLC